MKVGDLVTREVQGDRKKIRIYAVVIGISGPVRRRAVDILLAGDNTPGRWLANNCEVVEKNFE